ncbi:hypothetical protein ED733_003231 [Metarhizium rileyi]|uniref:GST N-terminal domain-containing protein n=1 Tax=Metarhizium rileyi (strain RCEF 4871) TaxID=1649241 RepID=A0A5C6GHF7_METRR|nr:hypothetical protein ED733_003231 [Metarhizium rileyi]
MAAPGSGAGLPGVAQFRLDIGVGLDGYPGLGEAYRQSPDASFRRVSVQSAAQHRDAVPGAAGGGQFGILAPTTVPSGITEGNLDAPPDGDGIRARGPARIVVDPPDLQAWREKLFNVDDVIVLTDDEFETYFPHVDNVYSHRSTQRYKRKPFISHYWDCRMKGRPPGTPKSDDPAKKRRKRNARERDLCDVKIRITEYFPSASAYVDREAAAAAADAALPAGQKFWTIQRVNGNGGNGKGDGVAGPHRHTLSRSDEIKKSSVQRYVARQETQARRTQQRVPPRKATGAAAATVKKHSKEQDLRLYSACYCPFSQRIWIALEAKGLPYQYCEVDPSKTSRPAPFTQTSPRGTVPAIRHDDWSCSESAVILEYASLCLPPPRNSFFAHRGISPNQPQLEDVHFNVPSTPLLPPDPKQRAKCRLWIDHINTRIVPSFYSLLSGQSDSASLLQTHITSLVLAADEQGPFFAGPTLSLVDVHFAPFAIRLSKILRPLRGWTDPVPGTRWNRWLDSLEKNVHVRGTTSSDDLYVDTVELLTDGAT